MLRRIEGTGRIETAYRVLQLCRAIFEYAIAEEICEHTPCNGLSKTLLPRPTRHHASITDPKEVGELMRAIDGFSGTLPVACALRLAPLLFVRPGELRKAAWSEFDLDGSHPHWRIPALRMKMREQHIVPLAKQAVAILRESVEWTSIASVSGGTVRLQAVTFNSSPNDRGVVTTMGARGNPFTGPGYSIVGAWHDQPLDADIVVVVAERFDTGAGTHCVTGGHRWLSSNGIASIRASTQKCVTKSGGGCGGIANPETSIISISGERATL